MTHYLVVTESYGELDYWVEKSAIECVERQRTARVEMDWLSTPLPELIFGPVIEEREVGAWERLFS